MKITKATCILLLLTFKAFAQSAPHLAKKIDSLYLIDQTVQLRYKEMLEKDAPADSIRGQDSLKRTTYVRHIQLAKEIIHKYGYPTSNKVGTEASHHFFVLIQHADAEPNFQKEMLPILDRLSRKGEISRKDYAYLYDRVKRNTGGKQRYGTQPSYGKGGTLFDENNRIILPPDLEDPKNVDKRRKSVGLEPIEKYYESILQLLGRPRKQ